MRTEPSLLQTLVIAAVLLPTMSTNTFAQHEQHPGAPGVDEPATEARVHRLADETFYAQVALQGALGEQTVDSRPSDATALALEFGVPIYVASDVLTAAEAERAEKGDTRLEESIGAKEIVDEIFERWPREPKVVR